MILLFLATMTLATDFDLDSLWNYDQPAESEKKFRDFLATASDSQLKLQVQTQIARAQGLQRKFDDAHRTLDAVQQTFAKSPPAPVTEVRYLLERGRVFNSSKKPDQARPLFMAAWDKAREHTLDFFAVDAAHMLGIVEPPDAALAWNEKAMALAEKSADPKAKQWLGALFNNIGWTYYDKQDYRKALECFERDLRWYAERNKLSQARIARYSIGKTLRALGRTEDALKLQQAIAKEIEQNKATPDGYVFEEIAECLLQLKRADEAGKYFRLAYDQLSRDEWLAANEPARLARLKELGGKN